VRILREFNERGGTEVSVRELGVDEHAVVKTLIMEDDKKNPMVVLMHGSLEVSTKSLARPSRCEKCPALRT
jgi:prolyl-tRNA editing enzyme YbaK/EbsC (Cys-tRNA(Pro) deacylase)